MKDNNEPDTQPVPTQLSIAEMEDLASRGYPRRREDAAFISAAIVSAGVAMFLATWGSGELATGVPRLGYFVGIALTSWFVLTFVATRMLLFLDGWFE